QAEQVVGAQPGVPVLECDVVDFLAAGEGVVDIGEHAPGGAGDVDLVEAHPQGAAQFPRVGPGGLAGAEPGHGVGQDVAAGAPELVHRPGAHQQGVGGVQPAGDPDDQFRFADGTHALHQRADLDVEGFVTVLGQACGVVGNEREAP